MRILVVDDEELVLHLLRRYLQKWGHEVTLALSGEEALAAFEREPFPLVITDWMMPGMSGLELIRRVRAHPSGSRIYALLLTGRAAKEDVVAGMDAGADDFLAKPFDKDELRVRVREGERIVELERARSHAEQRCQQMQRLFVSCSESCAHDLEQAAGMLGSLDPSTPGLCAEALSRLANARELMNRLRCELC